MTTEDIDMVLQVQRDCPDRLRPALEALLLKAVQRGMALAALTALRTNCEVHDQIIAERSTIHHIDEVVDPCVVRLTSEYRDPAADIWYDAGVTLYRLGSGQYAPLGTGLGRPGAISSFARIRHICVPVQRAT